MTSKKYLYALAALALVTASSLAVAMRANEVEFNYLDAKGQVVGVKAYHCAGGISQWGKEAANYVKYSTPCN